MEEEEVVGVVEATLVTALVPMVAVFLQAQSVLLFLVVYVTLVRHQAIGEVVPSPVPTVPTQSLVELAPNLIIPHHLFDIL